MPKGRQTFSTLYLDGDITSVAKDYVTLRKLPGQDQTLTQLQANIDVAFKNALSEPMLRGTLIKDVSIGTTDTTISHGLGRDYQGFVVARLKSDARVWESSTGNPQPSTQIILKASAACTVNLWVY